MTRRRIFLSALWLVLALAVLLILIFEGNPIRWTVTALAWCGGIVSQRLYDEYRSTRGSH